MKICILGGGESGVGAAKLAKKNGGEVFVSDYGSISEEFKNELLFYNIPFEEKGHTIEKIVSFDLVIKSPGIPNSSKVIQAVLAADIQLIGEVEYAYRYCEGKIIAITGSNGKTTVTNLIHHLLISAGISAEKGGNLGTCFSNLLLKDRVDWYVLEVSSFQLDDIVSFRPNIAVLLNITPDHLDRYKYDINLYAKSKSRIMLNQKNEDNLVCFSGDERVVQIANSAKSKVVMADSRSFDISQVSNVGLRGEHNRINTACSLKVVECVGLKFTEVLPYLNAFKNDDHRLQSIVKWNGVEWINDSKATNIDSVRYALMAIEKPIVWVAGGVDKGNDYSLIEALVLEKVKVIICLGVDNTKLKEAFKLSQIEMIECTEMKDVIALGLGYAEEGDTVLLSPACASFDLFKNYKDRGEQFVSSLWSKIATNKN